MSGTEDNPVHPKTYLAAVASSTYEVIGEVFAECERQDRKWGEQNHSPSRWFTILGEEFGEVAKETVGITFAHPWSTNYRTELTHTAAVAIRMIEAYDRRLKKDLNRRLKKDLKR